jgi:hypothetical protein
VDGRTVEQGSFSYTKAAEEKNAENVLVNWDNPKLADVYLKDWKRHWDHSERWRHSTELLRHRSTFTLSGEQVAAVVDRPLSAIYRPLMQ